VLDGQGDPVRGPHQDDIERPRRASRISSSRPGRRTLAPEIRWVYSCTIS
jgi:hypothetical protein